MTDDLFDGSPAPDQMTALRSTAILKETGSSIDAALHGCSLCICPVIAFETLPPYRLRFAF
jgi:hypothetical protein